MNAAVSATPPSDLDQARGGPPVQANNRFATLEQFQSYFDGLYNAFTNKIVPAVENARASRRLEIDVDAMRANGALLPHQIVIGQRIIDINISRELPDYVAHLTQARRYAIFEPIDKTVQVDTNALEMEFRRVMTYDGYIIPYIMFADSTKLHGWGIVDVCYDPAKPGAVSVEFVSAGNLFFDPRVRDIQQAPLIARRYEITSVDLAAFAKEYAFDPAVTAQLREKLENQEKLADGQPQECNYIYRTFYKVDGIVYAGWYSKDLQQFLRLAEPFYNGVDKQIETPPEIDPANPTMPMAPIVQWVPAEETEYPFVLSLNRITEDEPIVASVGRASMDYYTQEAATALWTAFVNGCVEASNVMWYPKEPNMDAPAAPKQIDFEIRHGAIFNQPMEAFAPPFPSSQLPGALDMLRTQNAEDTNQVAFAVNNRKDTRKTATEIEAATTQDSQMTSVSTTIWATTLGKIANAAWRIVQSQALQDKIAFVLKAPAEQIDPATQQPVVAPPTNDVELIGREYKVIPAGTVDFAERVEQINSMQSDFPIIKGTAAEPVFMEEYLRLKYPAIADKLIAPLQQQQQQALQMVQAMQPILQVAVTDEQGRLKPEFQQYAPQLQMFGITAEPAPPAPEQPSEQPTTA